MRKSKTPVHFIFMPGEIASEVCGNAKCDDRVTGKLTLTTCKACIDRVGSAGWAISLNGETYDADVFQNEADAIEEGTVGYNGTPFWIGMVCPPTKPEELFEVSDWLERVACDDDYAGEWAEDWDMSTKQQRAELESEVRTVISAWLDRHNLRPTFFNVKNARLIEPNTKGEAPK